MTIGVVASCPHGRVSRVVVASPAIAAFGPAACPEDSRQYSSPATSQGTISSAASANNHLRGTNTLAGESGIEAGWSPRTSPISVATLIFLRAIINYQRVDEPQPTLGF